MKMKNMKTSADCWTRFTDEWNSSGNGHNARFANGGLPEEDNFRFKERVGGHRRRGGNGVRKEKGMTGIGEGFWNWKEKEHWLWKWRMGRYWVESREGEIGKKETKEVENVEMERKS
jgi:hypothetical protein